MGWPQGIGTVSKGQSKWDEGDICEQTRRHRRYCHKFGHAAGDPNSKAP